MQSILPSPMVALEQAGAIGSVRWHAELHRLRGEIHAEARQDMAAAEASFLEALPIAREQKAKSFELRTATSDAKLMRSQGRNAEARALLAPVYEWFTEGHQFPDLISAKALLEQLDT